MIAFIGGGNMAEALIKGMAQAGMRDILVSEPREERRRHFEQTYDIKTTSENSEAARLAKIVIIAVKPQDITGVLDEIAHTIGEDKTVVSIAAGITIAYIQSRLKTKRLVRVMPNVAALAQESMSVISLCECFSDRDINMIREIFMASGKVMIMPEKYLDAVTALSGSGPAFIARFVALMAEAGEGLGLNEEDAIELAVQTLLGTSRLLEGGLRPEKLIEMVRSPGGTTEAGLNVLEEKGLESTVVEAIKAAARRAGELKKED
jgi:pyrroline-5-carboxylate reductase